MEDETLKQRRSRLLKEYGDKEQEDLNKLAVARQPVLLPNVNTIMNSLTLDIEDNSRRGKRVNNYYYNTKIPNGNAHLFNERDTKCKCIARTVELRLKEEGFERANVTYQEYYPWYSKGKGEDNDDMCGIDIVLDNSFDHSDYL